MKYILFRSPGELDADERQHELVAVEFGPNIYAVTDTLIKDIRDDLSAMPEYRQFMTAGFEPERIDNGTLKTRYTYSMMGAVYPVMAEKNILIEYGVIERPEG